MGRLIDISGRIDDDYPIVADSIWAHAASPIEEAMFECKAMMFVQIWNINMLLVRAEYRCSIGITIDEMHDYDYGFAYNVSSPVY